MDFKKSVEGHLTYLRKLKDYTEERLEKMPEGSLRRKKTREKMYYYLKSGHQEFSLLKYPGRRDIYIEKEWLQGRLKAIDKDIPVLERLLSDYAAICPNPGEWEFFKGEQNEYKKEERRHLYKGVYYRAKSEVVIAMVLESHDLEFKYEVALHVNGRIIYPDFVIRRKRDGKIFIWEHFGMIFSEEYRQKMYRRLEELHEAGFNPWDNLLMSFDSIEGSIDVDFVEKMVKLYLL